MREHRFLLSHVGLRGAVEPELVMEVELSSGSAGWWRRLRMEAGLGRDDLFSGLLEPPSCNREEE